MMLLVTLLLALIYIKIYYYVLYNIVVVVAAEFCNRPIRNVPHRNYGAIHFWAVALSGGAPK